jgi:hypothetical protein
MKLLESNTKEGDSPLIENYISLLLLYLSNSGHQEPG